MAHKYIKVRWVRLISGLFLEPKSSNYEFITRFYYSAQIFSGQTYKPIKGAELILFPITTTT